MRGRSEPEQAVTANARMQRNRSVGLAFTVAATGANGPRELESALFTPPHSTDVTPQVNNRVKPESSWPGTRLIFRPTCAQTKLTHRGTSD